MFFVSVLIHGAVLFTNKSTVRHATAENSTVRISFVPQKSALPQKAAPPPQKPVQNPAKSTAQKPEASAKENNEEAATHTKESSENLNENLQYNEGSPGVYDSVLALIKSMVSQRLVYPPLAKQRNTQGDVVLNIGISTNGTLLYVNIYASSGSKILDNAAVSLIKEIFPLTNVKIKNTLDYKINIKYNLT